MGMKKFSIMDANDATSETACDEKAPAPEAGNQVQVDIEAVSGSNGNAVCLKMRFAAITM